MPSYVVSYNKLRPSVLVKVIQDDMSDFPSVSGYLPSQDVNLCFEKQVLCRITPEVCWIYRILFTGSLGQFEGQSQRLLPSSVRQDWCAGLPFSKVVLCPQTFLSSYIKRAALWHLLSYKFFWPELCLGCSPAHQFFSSLMAQQSLASVGQSLMASASVSVTSPCLRLAKKPC